MNHVIGIGDYRVCKIKGDKIITHALASCVAVIFYCTEKNLAAMIHVALPIDNNSEKNFDKPGYYATSGIPLVLNILQENCGCLLNKLKIFLIGGAGSINQQDSFKIGEKNIHCIKHILAEKGLTYDASETGGLVSRTIELDVYSGKFKIRYQPIVI